MIKVLLTDDHKMVRAGLKAVIDEFDNISVVGQASTVAETMALLAGGLTVDVVLLDVNMPVQNGIEGAKLITKEYPSIAIIGLSMNDDHLSISSMLKAGATGYILKDSDELELEKAIVTVANGESYFAEKVTKVMMNAMMVKKKKEKQTSHVALSVREKEILKLVCDGMTNNEIGEQLFISARTVDTHRRNLLQKTATNNTAGLVKYAFLNGLIDMD